MRYKLRLTPRNGQGDGKVWYTSNDIKKVKKVKQYTDLAFPEYVGTIS